MNAHFSGEQKQPRRLAQLTQLENSLRALEVLGQSEWLDYIRRSLIADGVHLFADAFTKLLKAVEKQSKDTGTGKIHRLSER